MKLEETVTVIKIKVNIKNSIAAIMLLFFAVFFAVPAFSQSYLVHRYTEANGLPGSFVYDLTQDRTGRMWFATRRGIASYDGISWRQYTVTEGLPASSFIKIKTGGKDGIWALSDPAETGLLLFFFDGRIWQEMPPLPEDTGAEINHWRVITSFEAMETGQTNREDLFLIAVGTRTSGLLLWDGRTWTRLTARDGLLSDHVNGLAGLEGKLYAASDKGLSLVTKENGKFRIDNRLNDSLRSHIAVNAPVKIKGIALERNDRYPGSPIKNHRVWLCGDHWLGYFEKNNFQTVVFPAGINVSREGEVKLLPGYRNGIYIGLYLKNYHLDYHTGVFESLGVENGLIGEGATSVFMDFEKNVWFTSLRGVSKLVSRRFGSFQTKHGLLQDEVTAVQEYEPGKFVFGHHNGLTFYDSKTGTFRPVEFPRKDNALPLYFRVLDLKVDAQKNVWAAVSNSPLIKTNPRGDTRYYGEEKGLPHPALCIWIGSGRDKPVSVGTRQGAYVLRGDRFVPLAMGEGKPPTVRKIYEPSRQTAYFATARSGLYVHDRKTGSWKNYRNPGEPGANNIYAVLQDSRGRLFLGTSAGLFTLENEEIKRFAAGDFKIQRPVYFIIEDRSRQLWFGMDNGVIRRDGGKAVKYSTPEGLIGQETNRAAGIVDSRGRVWIGTNRGVSVYNRSYDNIDAPSPPARVRLLELEAGGRGIPLLPGKTVKLPFENNTLAFHFSAISFVDETRIRMKCKLEGFEEEWSEEMFPYNPVVRYRNLSPGRYRFYLKVKNAPGTWSKPAISPVIIVLEPFYRKWWFYLLGFVLFGGLAIGLHRYFARRRYFSTLEKQVKERTQQLRMTEEKYGTLFREIKDMVYISTPDGKFIDINPAGVELFGYESKEEILAVHIGGKLYADPEDRQIFQDEVRKKGYVKDYPLEVRRKDGGKLQVLLTVTAVRGGAGDVVAYSGIMRDITRQKEVEKQLERVQKMEAVGMLAGGVAHDLNNILSGLTSYPELLLMKIPDDSPLKKPLQTIKQTGEKAAAVVQDLLTLSRRGAALDDVVDLNEVVTDYLGSPGFEKLKSCHADARFTVRTAPDLQKIMGTPIHLFKTVMNLVSNAVEAMPGGGWVRVNTANKTLQHPIEGFDTIPPGTYVVLSVSDTGVGISPEDIPRIFEPFYTRKKMGRSGTGLGMSVIWTTTKDHGGYIDIKTQADRGTGFELYFPVTRKQPPPKDTIVSTEQFRGIEKILVIDDVAEQREVASTILDNLGYHVTAVSSGEQAIEYMKNHSIDLVIVDMILEKGINGLETYRQILDLHPGQKAIVVSGFSETEEVKKMQGLGAGIYLKKPYTINQLGQAVRKELDR